MDILKKTVFKCDGCDEKFTLNNDYERHNVKCRVKPKKCSFVREDKTQMQEESQHLQPTETTCPNGMVKCHKCDVIYGQSERHDCLSQLIERVNQPDIKTLAKALQEVKKRCEEDAVKSQSVLL